MRRQRGSGSVHWTQFHIVNWHQWRQMPSKQIVSLNHLLPLLWTTRTQCWTHWSLAPMSNLAQNRGSGISLTQPTSARHSLICAFSANSFFMWAVLVQSLTYKKSVISWPNVGMPTLLCHSKKSSERQDQDWKSSFPGLTECFLWQDSTNHLKHQCSNDHEHSLV